MQLWCGDGGRRKLNRRHQITYGRLPVCQCKAQTQNFKLQKYNITNCKNTKLQIAKIQNCKMQKYKITKKRKEKIAKIQNYKLQKY